MGEESHKKSKTKRRITIRKRMKSTIKMQRPEIRLETRRFLGKRPEFLAVCQIVVKIKSRTP